MNIAISTSHSDAAFYRDRKAMLVYPALVLPFVAILFFMFGGGKGERYKADQLAADQPGAAGFNASMPSAKTGKINGREVDSPGYGKGRVGQVLSAFTNTRHDSSSHGLKVIAASNHAGAVSANHASSLNTGTVATPSTAAYPVTARVSSSRRMPRAKASGANPYYYNAPKSSAYYSGTDRQLDAQLKTYEYNRTAQPAPAIGAASPTFEASSTPALENQSARSANVQVSDNLTATRLAEPTNSDAFNTAPTSGSRRQAERAVLSGGSSYGSKKTVAWMIPVVMHEDQVFKSGNTVKLRLTKEITADGITIPANTILHAVCQTSDDRLRMVVRSLQLGGQLIPLDLEVYDIDGIAGVNMPGLSNNTGGQLQSSAIQGIHVPGMGGLMNTVANQARMSASNSARQPTVRLKAGYNLYLKAS